MPDEPILLANNQRYVAQRITRKTPRELKPTGHMVTLIDVSDFAVLYLEGTAYRRVARSTAEAFVRTGIWLPDRRKAGR